MRTAEYNLLLKKLGDALIGHTFIDSAGALTATLASVIAHGCPTQENVQEVIDSVIVALPSEVNDLRRLERVELN